MSDPTVIFVPSDLPRRLCDAENPMPTADKDRYHWSHPDAEYVEPFFNLGIYRCPHCKLTFHAPMRPQ